MKTLQFFSADPSLVAPRDSAGVKAGQDPSMTTSYWGSLPSFLSSYISASGKDSTTDAAVSSPYKTFIVQGDRPYVMSECPQTCPPATDTPPPPAMDNPSPPTMNAPKTPSETDTPSIVFVHGIKIGPKNIPWKGSDSGWDCNNQYWNDAIKFLGDRGLTDLRTIQYYTGDRGCLNGKDEGTYSSDLHHDLYKRPCTDYHPGTKGTKWEGTNDESLYHVSCLFAQYLHHNFGQSSNDVILVAHSMGGIIVRETLYQMQEHAGQHPFPETIGRVTKAITFNSPHGGVALYPDAAWGCLGCQQSADLYTGSDLMAELSTDSGLTPQPNLLTKGLTTEWTIIGSECDKVVKGKTSIDMNAHHAVFYVQDKRKKATTTCYDHGGAIHDQSVEQDAQRYDCDTSDPRNHACGTDYKDNTIDYTDAWTSTKNGLRGLSQLYYSITGRLPDVPSGTRMAGKLPSSAEMIGSSRYLWLLSTTAAAWALLRR
jgi:pimeloyl-ACP methyl ester carboxylesterase